VAIEQDRPPNSIKVDSHPNAIEQDSLKAIKAHNPFMVTEQGRLLMVIIEDSPFVVIGVDSRILAIAGGLLPCS